jgi:hypothetical protein
MAMSNTHRWKSSDTSVAGSTVDRVLLGGPTGGRLLLIKEIAYYVNIIRSGVKPGSAAHPIEGWKPKARCRKASGGPGDRHRALGRHCRWEQVLMGTKYLENGIWSTFGR